MTASTLARPLVLALAVASQAAACFDPEPVPPADEDDDARPDDDDAPEPESTCPAESGPTMHAGNLTADEVWRAEDGPHVIATDMGIYANVTLERCARVQLGAAVTLSIGTAGTLVAEGEPDDGVVTFERLDPQAAWSTIQIVGGTAALEHARLVGGGDPLNRSPWMHGAVIARRRADVVGADPVLSVRDVVIEGSATQGIRLQDGGAFAADSENLTIVGSFGHPISAEASSAHAIPTGQYTGNRDDRILLSNSMPVTHDVTLTERGVPYLVGAPNQQGDLQVYAQHGPATLTLEPGVELQFVRGGILRIENEFDDTSPQAALVAVGTPDAEIVLTSAEPSPGPGDWLGVLFDGTPAPHAAMQHVHVEYAGGTGWSGSGSCLYSEDAINEAAIRITGAPTHQFVTDTTIVASAGHGIDRGWRDDVVVDFVASNEFDVPACRQTFPSASTGACPDPVPCD